MDHQDQRSSFRRTLSSSEFWFLLAALSIIPSWLAFHVCQDLIERHAVNQNDLAFLLKWLVAGGVVLTCVLFSRAIFLLTYKPGDNLSSSKKRTVFFLSCVAAIFAFGGFLVIHFLGFLPIPILPLPQTPSPNPFGTATTFRIYGRPLRKRGKMQRSEVKESTTWILDDKFSKPKHEWLDAARGEHSSIESFAKISIELGQLGCPPDLLIGVHQAAIDEIKHSRIGFSLDAANGKPMAPAEHRGLFGEAGHVFRVQRMALNTFADGCLHEARSALELSGLAKEESDAIIKSQIERITAEEETHVDLAWKIVRWCFAELKLDAHRKRLFGQLTRILDAAEKREGGDAEHRAIFERARHSLNEIYGTV